MLTDGQTDDGRTDAFGSGELITRREAHWFSGRVLDLSLPGGTVLCP